MDKHLPFILVFLSWLLCFAAANFRFCNGNPIVRCKGEEKEALLTFRQGLKDPSNRFSSWVGNDCCKWKGVLCHNTTGHVIRLDVRNPLNETSLFGAISDSLRQLEQLQCLDLSGNDFGRQSVPDFFGSLANLRYLNLRGAGLNGVIPHQLGNLSSLEYLALGDNSVNVGDLKWLSHLSSLKFLDLNGVDLSRNPNWLQMMNMLPALSELHLSSCLMNHTTPPSSINMSSLIALDLSYNGLGDSASLGWLSGLPSLVSLDVSFNGLSGLFPASLRNLTSIRSLNLAHNMLSSTLLEWLYHLSSLEVLDLSWNNFRGTISSAINNLTSLTELGLSDNSLAGDIPSSMGNLCKLRRLLLSGNQLTGDLSKFLGHSTSCIKEKLEELRLEDNQLSGQLPNQLGEFKSLSSFSISNNCISGPIPVTIGRLSSLEFLDLSWNCFYGTVSELHFANLTRLFSFDASFNPLTFRVNSDWNPPFQLREMKMSSSRMGPQFPSWLQTQKNLEVVNLSSAGISGVIPSSFHFSNLSNLHELDLSNNQIHGNLQSLPSARYIYLHSNNFTGPLPRLSTGVGTLDLSKNTFSGSLSPILCGSLNRERNLFNLDLSRNLLSGQLPDCWNNWKSLEVLKLDKNNLKGEIPATMGSLHSLSFLHLRENSLSGELPHWLQNLGSIKVLDLSENKFSGSIPEWIGARFTSLRVLSLHSNQLNGSIPLELCGLTSLQILDLANNTISKTIPKCFGNFTAMKQQNLGYFIFNNNFMDTNFGETISLVMKEQEYEYSSTLSGLAILDLSCNSLSGEIPTELTNLHGLHALNLSFNHLQGPISTKISNMKALESLDLSMNKLSGNIPESMASLNFLSWLNLSYNNLSGEIPLGTQIQGFNASSFIGNHWLHGPPLTSCCLGHHHTPLATTRGENHTFKWFYTGIPFGFIVGFWVVLGPLAFNREWRLAYFCFLDRLNYKIFGYG